jgi:hypothetical protein
MHSRSCFQHTTLGLQARQQPAQGTGHASQTTTERDEGGGGGVGGKDRTRIRWFRFTYRANFDWIQ